MAALPTDQDLKSLPLRALVGYAARCALRVLPFYDADEVDAKTNERHRESIRTAIDVALQFAAGKQSDHNLTETEESVMQAMKAAGESKKQNKPAAFSSNAAYAAVNAVTFAQASIDSPNRATEGAKVADAAATAAESAVSVDATAKHGAIRDCGKLQRLALGTFPEFGKPFDPHDRGPLGPVVLSKQAQQTIAAREKAAAEKQGAEKQAEKEQAKAKEQQPSDEQAVEESKATNDQSIDNGDSAKQTEKQEAKETGSKSSASDQNDKRSAAKALLQQEIKKQREQLAEEREQLEEERKELRDERDEFEKERRETESQRLELLGEVELEREMLQEEIDQFHAEQEETKELRAAIESDQLQIAEDRESLNQERETLAMEIAAHQTEVKTFSEQRKKFEELVETWKSTVAAHAEAALAFSSVEESQPDAKESEEEADAETCPA